VDVDRRDGNGCFFDSAPSHPERAHDRRDTHPTNHGRGQPGQ
jgi:hypothetical protein